MIDNLFNQWKIERICPITENQEVSSYFSNNPLFGKPTEVEDWSLGYIINGDATGLTDEENDML